MKLLQLQINPRIIIEPSGVTAVCDALGMTGSGETEAIALGRLAAMCAAYLRALSRQPDLLELTLTEAGLPYRWRDSDLLTVEVVVEEVAP